MKYFDVSAMIGAHFAPRESHFFTASDLMEELGFFGIDEAIVYHGLAREYDFATGNIAILECIKDVPRLHGCWVVGLHHMGALPPPRQLVKEAIAHGIKAARLFFGGLLSDSSQVDVLAYGELLAELERHRLPTIVEFEGDSTLSVREIMDMDVMLSQFPELPVILLGSRMSGLEIRALYPRLERFQNLHIATCGLQLNGLIENIVTRFGQERLVFAANFPWFGGGQAKIALAYADISNEARQAIASDNISRLINGIVR